MRLLGWVDEDGRPRIEVTVRGARGSAKVAGLIDTGFDGEIVLPVRIAVLGFVVVYVLVMSYREDSFRLRLCFKQRNVD